MRGAFSVDHVTRAPRAHGVAWSVEREAASSRGSADERAAEEAAVRGLGHGQPEGEEEEGVLLVFVGELPGA